MLSSDAVALFADESFDFIYIDARHDYTAVMEDLHAWYGCATCCSAYAHGQNNVRQQTADDNGGLPL